MKELEKLRKDDIDFKNFKDQIFKGEKDHKYAEIYKMLPEFEQKANPFEIEEIGLEDYSGVTHELTQIK